MPDHTVKLTTEQIKLLLGITGPRIAADPTNQYNDWSVDLDRRLRAALNA